MQRILNKVVTTKAGTFDLTLTLEQYIKQLEDNGVSYTIKQKENGETWVTLGDYKNLNADSCVVYKNNEIISIDFCLNNIEYFELSDGTRYSCEQYKELMKEHTENIKYCYKNGEYIEQSEALKGCTWRDCEMCKNGGYEEFIITDKELGYRFEFDHAFSYITKLN